PPVVPGRLACGTTGGPGYRARVPMPYRNLRSVSGRGASIGSPAGRGAQAQRITATGFEDLRERALAVLTDPQLASIVDLVAYPDAAGVVVANSRGACRFARAEPDSAPELLSGEAPVTIVDPLALTPATVERLTPWPTGAANAYPFAGHRLLSLFADTARAPDLAVVHTGRHYWPERGGHLGEHGSLAAVQSRAPFLLSGAGVTQRGILDAACRTVDIAPTLAWLAGMPTESLSGLDGSALTGLAEVDATRHTVGLLWDGAPSNELLAMAASGELPAVARLLESGCALRGGAIAEFPSVTLVNHTSALTGVGPGRHGIVNNAFYDRERAERVLANDASTWHRATELLRPDVRTVFELVGRGATACVNEPVDRGAGYSTFSLVRASGSADGARSLGAALPSALGDPHATGDQVAADADYAWYSQVDALGLEQMRTLFAAGEPAPRLTWWNTLLTDTGHHAGGPRSDIARASLRDADRRLGAFLDHLAAVGLAERTTVILTADHGSEGADPSCRGDWDEALRAAGIPFRDEAYGFIYLGV
ncbi:MAG TPA: alkaline phosphatase family protein, partial [Mycobacteriales bacterium]|nr:alkaline phosphatase family protein [Mycobacteriales bacterium]